MAGPDPAPGASTLESPLLEQQPSTKLQNVVDTSAAARQTEHIPETSNPRDFENVYDDPLLPPAASQANGHSLDVGWRPWKVVIGCFCLTVPVYGLLSSIGLFQTQWKSQQLSDYTDSDIAWIISMFGFLDCFFGAPSGVLFDRYGGRWTLAVGSVLYVGAFIGLAFSTTYGQFMGCMVVAGVAAAPVTTVAFATTSQWFRRWQNIATGCVTVGTAIGGIFFSLVLKALFEKLVWKYAILALAGIIAGCLVLGNALVESNLPARRTATHNDAAAAANWWRTHATGIKRMLWSYKFWLVSYAIFALPHAGGRICAAYELVLFIQWGSIPMYAVSVNFGSDQFYLIMSYNVGAIVGRTLPPWLADGKLGPLKTTIMMNMLTFVVVLAVWLPVGASSIAALYAVVLLLGIGTGSFVPLGVSCIGTLCEPGIMGTWIGSAYTMVSFATLIGNPATAAILEKYQTRGLVAFLAAVLASGLVSVTTLWWTSRKEKYMGVRADAGGEQDGRDAAELAKREAAKSVSTMTTDLG
ncbi:major facilitator superfamily domain-containing protein [Bombardia bombarda]|uniref:Major facilitator superfamily domain-containing protein n=1 Tax=Bombardia bombarda TaxID=252184 RepID=A0AA39TUM3_9PEZI|nr:major facilitator superfamily domain-containing protein [Bombardia bombarda]